MLVRLVQSRNASFPITVTKSGISTFVSFPIYFLRRPFSISKLALIYASLALRASSALRVSSALRAASAFRASSALRAASALRFISRSVFVPAMASVPSLRTLFGKVISKSEQPENASLPTNIKLSGSLTSQRFKQFLNAPFPICLSPSGKTMRNALQPANAPSAIPITPCGTVYSIKNLSFNPQTVYVPSVCAVYSKGAKAFSVCTA